MVLVIDGQEVTTPINVPTLHATYQLLKANSLSLLSRPVRLVSYNLIERCELIFNVQVSAEERCVYVGQREMAVSERGDWVEVLGSEDATTCHIVIIRDVSGEAGVTGVAHIDR